MVIVLAWVDFLNTDLTDSVQGRDLNPRQHEPEYRQSQVWKDMYTCIMYNSYMWP